jgi:hypothetical protein
VPAPTPRLARPATCPPTSRKAAELKAKGVDEIVGTSVNDAFVMGAWNRDQGSDDITMLADGNGEFAEALGLTMDASKFGMGKRSQRYSAIINDGVVEQLNVEAPGEYSAPARRRCSASSKDARFVAFHLSLAFRSNAACGSRVVLQGASEGGVRCQQKKRFQGRFKDAIF